jgi:hypothetical protein
MATDTLVVLTRDNYVLFKKYFTTFYVHCTVYSTTHIHLCICLQKYYTQMESSKISEKCSI